MYVTVAILAQGTHTAHASNLQAFDLLLIGLPPLNDDNLFTAVMRKFASKPEKGLSQKDFQTLYGAILRRVRDRYVKVH